MNGCKEAFRESNSARARPASGAPTMAPSHRLAQRLGNQGLHHLLMRQQTVQAKLTVSHPSDPCEREADEVADRVMGMPAPVPPRSEHAAQCASPLIQRKCAACEEQELQREAVGEPEPRRLQQGASEIGPYVDSLSARGEPLAPSTREFFEPRFGMDFGAVRIHTGPDADSSAKAIDAVAYATGSNIVFRGGHYDPASERGRKLLAHELVHVVQQGGARSSVMPEPMAAASRGEHSVLTRQEQASGRAPESPEPKTLNAEFAISQQSDDWLIAEIERIRVWLARQTTNSEAEDRLLSVLAAAGQLLFNRHPDILNGVLESASEDVDDGTSLALVGPITQVTVTRAAITQASKLVESGVKTITRPPPATALAEASGGAAASSGGGAAAAGGLTLAGLAGWAFLIFVFFAPRGEYISPEQQKRIVTAIVFAASKARPRPAPKPTKRPIPMDVPSLCVEKAKKLSEKSGCNFQAVDPRKLPLHASNEIRNPQASLYCESVTTDEPCQYGLYPPRALAGMLQEWAMFDAFDGGSLIECKCGYDAIVDRANEQGYAPKPLADLISQLVKHLDRARDCGWPYKVIVSSEKLAIYIRNHGPLGVNVETAKSDICD